MTLPQRLLVATDHSEFAEHAGRVAMDWAARLGAELHWAQGVERLGDATPPHSEPLIASYVERARQAAEEKLHAKRDDARTRGLVSEAHLVDAPVAEGIVLLAQELEVDCIVAGTRGLTGLRHLLLGSTAEHIVRQALCRVLLVRGDRSPLDPGTIVLGDDLTDVSSQARDDAAALAADLGVPLHVVHAVDLGALFLSMLDAEVADGLKQQADTQARRVLDAFAAAHPDCEITPVLPHEPAAAALLAQLEKTQGGLVVIGTRAEHGLRDQLLGSVAERVVRLAPCSVLVSR